MFHGRSAVLFVVLAGLSFACVGATPSRTTTPRSPPDQHCSGVRSAGGPESTERRRARVAALTRAPILWLAGLLLLADAPSPVYVILQFYAGYFVVGALALGWSVQCRALVAAGLAVVVPVVLLVVPSLPATVAGWDRSWPDFVPHGSTLLLTGAYPLLPWAGYFLAGMALADSRLLRRPAHTAAIAGALIAATHAVSLLSGLLLNEDGALANLGIGSRPGDSGGLELSAYDPQARLLSQLPSWAGQLSAQGHTTSMISYASCVAFAVTIIATCFAVQPWLSGRVAAPAAAFGRSALAARTSCTSWCWAGGGCPPTHRRRSPPRPSRWWCWPRPPSCGWCAGVPARSNGWPAGLRG